MKALYYDKETCIEAGINDDGELYLCNPTSGYNLRDTPENREYLKRDFFRYTGKDPEAEAVQPLMTMESIKDYIQEELQKELNIGNLNRSEERAQKITEAELQKKAYTEYKSLCCQEHGYDSQTLTDEAAINKGIYVSFNEFLETDYKSADGARNFLGADDFKQWVGILFPLSAQMAEKEGWEYYFTGSNIGFYIPNEGWLTFENCEKILSMADAKLYNMQNKLANITNPNPSLITREDIIKANSALDTVRGYDIRDGYSEYVSEPHSGIILTRDEAIKSLELGIRIGEVSHICNYHGSHEGEYSFERVGSRDSVDQFFSHRDDHYSISVDPAYKYAVLGDCAISMESIKDYIQGELQKELNIGNLNRSEERVQKIPEAELQQNAYDAFLVDIADVDDYGYPLHDYELEGFLPFNEFIKTIYNDINAVSDYLYSGEFEQWIEYKFPLSSKAAIKDGWELSRHDDVFGYESSDGSGFVSLEDCENRLSLTDTKIEVLQENNKKLLTPTENSHDYDR